MAAYQTLSIMKSDALDVIYDGLQQDLPELDRNLPRDVLEQGLLQNGMAYSVQVLHPKDYKAVYAVCKAEYDADQGNLVERSEQEIHDMLDFSDEREEGSIAVGLVLNGKLGALGIVDLIDDEKDEGRGRPVHGYSLSEKVYFKSGTTHPCVRGMGLIDKIYPYRLAIAASFDRPILATKTIGASVKKAYVKNGWSSHQHDLIEVKKNGEMMMAVLDTYTMTRQDGVKWLKDNRHDIFSRLPSRDAITPSTTIEALSL